MLDFLLYIQTEGIWTKTVIDVVNGTTSSVVTDIPGEIAALQAQIEALQASEQNHPTMSAIINYYQQITILGG